MDRPVRPTELLSFTAPALALAEAQDALRKARVLLTFYHGLHFQDTQQVSELERDVKVLVERWGNLAVHALTRAQAALAVIP